MVLAPIVITEEANDAPSVPFQYKTSWLAFNLVCDLFHSYECNSGQSHR